MKVKRKLFVEQYLHLLESRNYDALTISHLLQIISIHGSVRTQGKQQQKHALVDAVKSVDLMDPSRSTLKDNICSGASLALEEVIQDLDDLDWRECSVTSIETVCSMHGRDEHQVNLQQSSSTLSQTTVCSQFTPIIPQSGLKSKATKSTELKSTECTGSASNLKVTETALSTGVKLIGASFSLSPVLGERKRKRRSEKAHY